ncbi:MAG: ZPR1 zinc finger domain-containing protein, partial [Promethearchaeota archaeon]
MSEEARKGKEEFSFKCPACKNGMITISKTIYDLPDKDKMLIIKFECNQCNFSKNDIIPLTTNFEPGILSLKVTCEDDLNSKIYRSPVGKLEIPELELIVEPGPSADFFYTNVEGILDRFEQAVHIYNNSLEENDSQKDEIEQVLNDIEKAKAGKLNF